MGQTLRREAIAAGLAGRPAPRKAEEIEEEKGVQGQSRHAELDQQGEVRVVDVENAKVVALHAAAKFGVHSAGGPSGEGPFLEHRPARVIDGQPRLDRAALPGAIPKRRLQRMVAEADRQADPEARDRQQVRRCLQTAFDKPVSESDGGDGKRDPDCARHGRQHG